MLQLYDVNKNKLFGLTEYKELKNERSLDGDEVLSFSFAQNNSKYDSIKEECYIRTSVNEFVVKEVSVKDDWTDFVAKINVEELKGSPFTHFETVEQSCINSVNLVLTGSNWTIGSCDVTKFRTVRKSNCSAWDILQEIRKVYNCDFKFDAINKKVYIYQSRGADKGTYFSEELNLTSLEVQGDSYDFCTRIIPFGKDGLDITSVNSGVNYVENYQYSSKIITLIWEDNRYLTAQSLKDDAVLKLNDLSKPIKSFSAKVIDLAKVSNKYTDILDYDLGDTIILLSKDKKVKEKQRIVKIVEYPDEPEKNSCEIANRILTFEDMQAETQDAVDTVNSVTTSDGQLDGSKIDGIDYAKIINVSIGTADIQDASIVTAKIGDLQVTGAKIANATITTANIALAAIGTAQIQNGAITNALIGTAAVNTTQIADGSITDAKIVELTAEKITAGTLSVERLEIRGSTTSIVYELNNITGALQSQNVDTLNGEIVTPRSITAEKIVANAITAAEIASRTITANKIATNTITAAEIATGTITASEIAAEAITAAKIATGAITVDKIASNVGSNLDLSSNESVKIAVGQIGCNNIIKNSRADFGIAGWAKDTALSAFSQFNSTLLNQYVFRLTNNLNQSLGIYQTGIKLKPSTKYTLQFKALTQYTSTTVWLGGQKNGTTGTNYDYQYIAKSNYSNTGYEVIKYTFTTASDVITAFLRIANLGTTSGSNGYVYVTDIQLEEGENATAWKPDPNEIKTTDVIIDTNGLTVSNGAITVKNNNNTVTIDGQYNMHKIVATGTVYFSGTDHNVINVYELEHGLLDDNGNPYMPCYRVFQKQYGQTVATETPAFSMTTGTTVLGFDASIRAWTDNAKIYFEYLRSNNRAANESSYYITLTYYLYWEVAI